VNISATSPVSSELIVYDILGRIVKTYNLKQGQSQIEWQATDNEGLPLSSGIYFIKFNDPGSNTIRRVVYSK
jgi:flagellar hook assembly protein FlgD